MSCSSLELVLEFRFTDHLMTTGLAVMVVTVVEVEVVEVLVVVVVVLVVVVVVGSEHLQKRLTFTSAAAHVEKQVLPP